MDELIKLLDTLVGLDENITKDDYYTYNGTAVPRVTNILKETIGQEYLIKWAANVGKGYFYHSQKAKNIGTAAHQWIEDFLTDSPRKQFFNFSEDVLHAAGTAMANFTAWYTKFSSFYGKPEIVKIEETLLCPYYGGTADCIWNINGSNILVDFKTSKKIDYSYIMQLCAYKYIIDNYRTDLPHIDAIGIIRIDKEKSGVFEDLFLNECVPAQKDIIDMGTRSMFIAVQQYYSINIIEKTIANYQKEYDIKKVFTIKENNNE